MEMTGINNRKNDVYTAEGEVSVAVEVEKPKKVLYFSDGIIEEFTDEECEEQNTDVDGNANQIVEANLTWAPWLLYKTSKAGNSIMAGCDYVGGALASFLGITTPKYQYEIDEFRRIKEENEKLETEKQDAACWQESKKLNCNEAITKEMDKPDERF